MKTITFSKRHINKGFDTILFAGTVVFTKDPTIFHVPESSLRVLEENKIPYEIIEDWHPDYRKTDGRKR